jgi:prolyl oligopeptidase
MAESRIAYPSSRREPEVKDFHGNKVSDPYVWLEKPDASDVKVRLDFRLAI